MKPFSVLVFSVLILPLSSPADITVQAKLQGNSTVHSSEIVRHRKSLDCYTFGKADDYQDYEKQEVPFAGDRTITGSGEGVWASAIAHPFAATARNTVLSASVVPSGGGERVTLALVDQFAGYIGTIHSEKCRHTDGSVAISNATTTGTIKIQYRVPANVWAVELRRVAAEGAFSITHQQSVTTAFNSKSDSKKNKSLVLWVQPGQWIEQEIQVDYIGGANIGSTVLEFVPLGTTMTAADINGFLQRVIDKKFNGNMSEKEAREFLLSTMEIVHAGREASVYTSRFTLQQMKQLSDQYFRLANSVFKNLSDGHSLKVASALAAFQIARTVLIEMSAYCQDVEVYLPFTGEKQKVLGLKAASFWLTRSMNYIRTYSYDPAEVFLQELQRLQERGLSPADIVKDKVLKKKIQTSYLLLTQTMAFDSGPFNRAYVDFHKMAATFKNIQSLGPDQENLLRQLKLANQSEDEFIALFAATMGRLRPTTTDKLDYQAVFAKITEMRTLQAAVTKQLKDSVRLLSIESTDEQGQVVNQVVGQVIDLLTNQVNIFKNPVDVPYFDGIREAFYNANIKGLDGVANGCFNLEGLNQ